ncbi:hypothetical protein BJX63DRAFT_419358 [Aspergillus granulosus]|uniref:MARVEL domain-containing protein n=1 Tax=Aspergillus granulosus TaxID=176169 RepID=A0ABR4HRE3_9EURO
MILTFLGFLARVGVFISSVITIGLNARFYTNRAWSDDLIAYIIAISAFSIVACLVPPYPNFLWDLFWALGLLLAAVFALVVQFAESSCYGFRPENAVNCATYKAGTAFAFLAALAWFASGFFVSAEDEKEAQADSGEKQEPRKKKKIKLLYAAPAFAVYLLDRVPIPNVHVNLLNPTNDSIQFSVLSDIRVPDAVTVNFDSMLAQFFRPETRDDPIPIATVELPKLKFSANQKVTLENQTMKLGDIEQFALLVEDVAYNPRFSVAGQAKTKVGIAGLSTTVDLMKVVSLPGFDNFPNIWVNQIGVMPPDELGNNVYGEVVVFNPAPATVTLVRHVLMCEKGEVTLAVIIANITLGQATVAVNNIVPGNNTFIVRAKLNTADVEANIDKIILAEIPYLREGNVMASAKGVSVVYQGQHLAYWEKAFQSIQVSATRPVKELLGMVVDSGVSFLLGGIQPGEGLKEFVDNLADQILETVRELPEDGVEGYTDNLGALAKLVLRLLTLLGIL